MKPNISSGIARLGMLFVTFIAFCVAVMLLWNWLIPSIFGLKTITIWEAGGLFLLSRILFSSFFGGGKPLERHMDHFGDNPIHEKWMKMSEEERKEFINKRQDFFHDGPFARRDFFGSKTGNSSRNEKSENDI